ncbi:MAG: hypothetical protein U5R30_11675 [Deltaproteobacteria bacterium]|nr:hypothetical protein [Deltaproteobacteria bacterium]
MSGLEESISVCQKDVKDKEDAFMAAIRDARAKGMQKKEALMAAAATEEENYCRDQCESPGRPCRGP